MNQSILKSAVKKLCAAYPDVDQATFVAVCKAQFSWALTAKETKEMCMQATGAMAFFRETEPFIEQMKWIAVQAKDQYQSSVSDISEQEKSETN